MALEHGHLKKPFEHKIHNTRPRILEKPLPSLPFGFPGFLLYGVWSNKTIQHLLFFFAFYFLKVLRDPPFPPDLLKQTPSRCRAHASHIGMYLAGPVHKSKTPHILKMTPLSFLHHNDKRTCEFTITALLPILSQSFPFSLVCFPRHFVALKISLFYSSSFLKYYILSLLVP